MHVLSIWPKMLKRFAQAFSKIIPNFQFTRFLSFALTLIPHFCQSRLPNEQSCMTLAVRYALLESRQIEEEMEKLPLPPRDPLEKYLVQNLLMLIKWQEQSEEGAPLKHIG